jgi:GTP-binding protein
MEKLPVVTIVGRVNSGKSTLFNRIIKKPLAVVDKSPGVTRDRLRKKVEWNDFIFELVDTGGLFPPEEDAVWPEVRKNIERAVRESDLIIFLVDLALGLTPFDEEVSRWLRKMGKDVILVGNKADVKRRDPAEFLTLGFGEPIEISASHGRGIDELLDRIKEKLVSKGILSPGKISSKTEKIRVSIIGKPNVGKSSLLNALAGEEVVITSETPGTTRDAVDIETENFVFIDTAGLKKKYRDEIEYYSALRSMRALHYAEVAVIVLDLTLPITKMDKKIIGTVEEEGKSMVIALNKADLVSPEERRELFPYIKNELSFVDYVPKIFTSAKTLEGINYLEELIKKVNWESGKRIEDDEIEGFIYEAVERNAPPSRILSFKQVGVKPPTFLINSDGEIPSYYIRYLINRLRSSFVFLGNPIRIRVKSKKRKFRR